MRAIRAIAAAGLLALLIAAAPSVEADAPMERWIVGFEELPPDLGVILRAAGATDAVAFTTIDAVAVTLPAVGADTLLARPDVVGARAERRVKMHLSESVPFIGADRETLDVTADVPLADGGMATRASVDGTGQTVAIVDTGVWGDHPDLTDRMVAYRDFEFAYAGELLLTADQLDAFAEATGPAGGWTDDIGHGTHVAGIVAGTGASARGRENNNRGVAPGSMLVDLRISPQAHTTDNNFGWERNALAAYDWLIRHHADTAFGPNGITVVNNSWGTGDSSVDGEPLDYTPFGEVLDALDEAGVSVVFSAGNSGPRDFVAADRLPTGHPTVITVAAGCKPGTSSSGCNASDPDARIASFSSYGTAVDITAPGVDILSTINASTGWALGKLSGDFSGDSTEDEVMNTLAYSSFSGTSMSGPHIAGVVALMREADPTLRPADIRFIIAATARDLLLSGRDIATGWGQVDVPAALDAIARNAAGESLAEQFPTFEYRETLGD